MRGLTPKYLDRSPHVILTILTNLSILVNLVHPNPAPSAPYNLENFDNIDNSRRPYQDLLYKIVLP